MPSYLEWSMAILFPIHLTWLTSYLLKKDIDDTTNEKVSPPSYTLLVLLYLFLDSSYSHLFHTLLLVPARYLSCHLPGAVVPPWEEEEKWSKQEVESNDVSIVWPSKDALMQLPSDWIVHCKDDLLIDHNTRQKRKNRQNVAYNERKSRQPYYLNHVRGSTRVRHASQRIGAALGTVSSSFILCSFVKSVQLRDIGLDLSKDIVLDLCCGIFVGGFIVSIIFVLELVLGWVQIIVSYSFLCMEMQVSNILSPFYSLYKGYFDTAEPNENFLINFTWDILFHVGVSINEEIMMRGWMFVLCARGMQFTCTSWFSDQYTAGVFAVCLSILLQSIFFAMMHFHSPGSTSISLMNLFIGGIAASFNFLAAKRTLWLGIGWHFGWNIFMGHLLGRSTSGIPMSCSVFNVVPRPGYEKYHGGTFGPEQGVLAPVAYLVGMCIVLYFYGWDAMLSYDTNSI
jgi:hypothetical protein